MNTGKIIKITEDTIFIGYEDGSIKEIQRSSVDFEPSVGDLVELYGEIAIKANGKNNRKLTNQFNFSKLSLTNKINLITIVALLVISFVLPTQLQDNSYIANFSILVWSSSILVGLLNIVILIIQAVKKKQHSEKKISVFYILTSIAVFIVSLILFAISTSDTQINTDKNSETSHIIDPISGINTVEELLKARGISVSGYGEALTTPKEEGDKVIFELGNLEDFNFNGEKFFDKNDTDSVTAIVSMPKSLYLNDINKGDILSISGETSQNQEMGIVVSNYFLANHRRDSSSSKPTEEIDTDKSHYGEVDYDQWNHDEVENNTKVKFSGKVLQAMEEGSSHTLRIAINNDYDKVVLVTISNEHYNRVIADDDQITIYGITKGRQSYTTVFGASKTLPYMLAYMYEN